MQTRRKFLKAGCIHCAAMLGAGMLLESCSSSIHLYKAPSASPRLMVPVQEFMPDKNMIIVRTKDLENDILLVKKGEHYNALYLQCTHEGVGLSAMATKIVCTAHGSVFDLDGNVVKEPALKPLRKFETTLIENNVLINLT